MKDFTEKTLSSEQIFEGRIINLQVDEVELPNGKKSKRELVKHPGAVAIIPITREGKIVLVRQYRKPLEKMVVEIPAGKLEKNEAPFQTAERELQEETGYRCQALQYVTSFYTSPGFADEIVHLYYTDQLERLEVPLDTDEDEFVEVIEVTLDEAFKLVREKQIYDAKTAYAIQYLQLKQLVKGS
ncbi:NUDIX hydrolase [Bacillus solimangrovi]|uniref:ADP-ribose pyrophosphatase n=1 Tax=Bacillus solimangrovi TaxID=1305675 RepID=A0A1E5LHN8_9BACI|nr:NUDIX hydrolase [Bacillus solimangrovi]OEH93602.1 ADP-ribose pyrophosphatase [Bacillus solimangrovi]